MTLQLVSVLGHPTRKLTAPFLETRDDRATTLTLGAVLSAVATVLLPPEGCCGAAPRHRRRPREGCRW